MKKLLLVLTVLAGISFAACSMETPGSSGHNALRTDLWRRTDQGWEKTTDWYRNSPPKAAAIHPALIASFQLLACVGGLFAVCPSQRSPDED